ncbi:uncharacterized protein ARMOST_10316 [Armillaria ostoyae]|uniref:Uncharacterized protein n=1 Tax=Armillaria ostoyae TaxID=47428 RepID=A0A284RDZ2_ARMOS|nr:uncharacterized protein ARMOST_10316 [Armillaria ostoyae]
MPLLKHKRQRNRRTPSIPWRTSRLRQLEFEMDTEAKYRFSLTSESNVVLKGTDHPFQCLFKFCVQYKRLCSKPSPRRPFVRYLDDMSKRWLGVEMVLRQHLAHREIEGTCPTLPKTRRTDRAEGSRRPKGYSHRYVQLEDGHIFFEKDPYFPKLTAIPCRRRFLQRRERQQLQGGSHGMLLRFAATFPLRSFLSASSYFSFCRKVSTTAVAVVLFALEVIKRLEGFGQKA